MSSSPHDSLFKAVFGQPEHARGALRAVVPTAVGEAIEWSSLALCPGSFVDPALSGRHTDLLFSAAWRGGGELLVYLLFEHQSTSDDRMAFRLLGYQLRIWERWLSEQPRARSLPVIVPVVLYHGLETWSAPVAFEALFDVPEAARPALAPYLVRFTYLLDDLSEVPDAQLRTRAMTALARLVEACFKHARTRADLLEILAGWAEILRDVLRAPNGLEALAQVMRYILLVNDHVEQDTLRAFLELVVEPEAKDAIMTAGERLIQQGVEQGVQQGMRQGVEQGMRQGVEQGERALLLRLLRKRFGTEVSADVERRVDAALPEQIEIWADRVLSAQTLGELLAD
jgi:predicted transposase/invertase (TIGR01784 family)